MNGPTINKIPKKAKLKVDAKEVLGLDISNWIAFSSILLDKRDIYINGAIPKVINPNIHIGQKGLLFLLVK